MGMLAYVRIRGTRMPRFVIEREVPRAGNLSDAQKSVNALGMGRWSSYQDLFGLWLGLGFAEELA